MSYSYILFTSGVNVCHTHIQCSPVLWMFAIRKHSVHQWWPTLVSSLWMIVTFMIWSPLLTVTVLEQGHHDSVSLCCLLCVRPVCTLLSSCVLCRHLFLFIFCFLVVCVCVCVRERERVLVYIILCGTCVVFCFVLICCFIVVVVWGEGVRGQAGRVESAIHFKQAVN